MLNNLLSTFWIQIPLLSLDTFLEVLGLFVELLFCSLIWGSPCNESFFCIGNTSVPPESWGRKYWELGKIVYYSEYHFTSPSHGKTSLSLPPRACWKKEHLWWWRKRTFTVVTERRITYHISIPGEKGCLTSLILSLVEDWWALGLYWKAWWTCLCSPILSGICALQDLGVTRQAYNPPCDILVKQRLYFHAPFSNGSTMEYAVADLEPQTKPSTSPWNKE